MSAFDSYLKRGLVKKTQTDFAQIRNQIARAKKDLQALCVVIDKDAEWAVTMAYQAMLRAGRSLLFSYGYLPADGQQHRTVVELTKVLLGSAHRAIAGHFERLRRRRNTFFYDSMGGANRSEAESASASAERLITAVEEKILERDPQYGLGLD